MPQLKEHTKKMFGVSQSLSKNRYNQDLRLARGKFLKNVGYVTLTAAAIGGIAIADAGDDSPSTTIDVE